MITLYRENERRAGGEIGETFEGLVPAHCVVDAGDDGPDDDAAANVTGRAYIPR